MNQAPTPQRTERKNSSLRSLLAPQSSNMLNGDIHRNQTSNATRPLSKSSNNDLLSPKDLVSNRVSSQWDAPSLRPSIETKMHEVQPRSRKPTFGKQILDTVKEETAPTQSKKTKPSIGSFTNLMDRPSSPLLFVPPHVLSFRDLSNRTFISFQDLIKTHSQAVKDWSPKLGMESPSRKVIGQQLAFNRTMQKNFFESFSELKDANEKQQALSLKSQQLVQRRMPPIKKYPTKKIEPPNNLNDSILESEDGEENPAPRLSMTSSKSMKLQSTIFATNSLLTVQKSIRVYKHYSVDRPGGAPTVRQGATFTNLGKSSLLFGGLSFQPKE